MSEEQREPIVCPECDGRGEVLDAPDRVLDGRAYWVKCEDCKGTGQKISDRPHDPR